MTDKINRSAAQKYAVGPQKTAATEKPSFALKELIIIFLILIAAASYYLGQDRGFARGYVKGKNISWQQGYDKGHSDGLSENGPRISDDETKLANLRNEYNTLSDNYNSLRNAVIRYAGTAGSYQPSTHISCTSNDIGSFTYTNCY